MKKILILLLLCCSFKTKATISASGLITTNTTWTKANSPYIVNGNLAVDSGVTLTIQPGVTIHVDNGYSFYIDGRLKAEGTATDSIIFTGNIGSRWAGITFRVKAKNDTSKIRYCRFDYGENALFNKGTNLYVDHSVFRHSTNIAIITFGLSPAVDFFTMIDNCLITENHYGVWNSSTSSIPDVITNSEITYNHVGYEGQSANGAVIDNNNINYNERGVWLEGGANQSVKNNTFRGNTFFALGLVGGAQANTTLNVSENLFTSNARALYLSEVHIASISRNTVAYNDIAIEHFQDINNTTPSSMIIDSNCITNSTSYNFKENGHVDFQVKNNWWGITSTTGIDSTISDYYDNFTSGKITYLPILSSPYSGCIAVSPPTTKINNTLLVKPIKLYPNPSNGEFVIEGISADKNTAVHIINMYRQEVNALQLVTGNKIAISLNVPAGVYYVTVSTAAGKQTGKIIIR